MSGSDEDVKFSEVSRSYGRVQALSHISVTISRGCTVLLGRNGAGKSTFCRILAGLEPPDSGSLVQAGGNVSGFRARRDYRGRVGYLPQSFATPPSVSVSDYLYYAAWLKGLPARQAKSSIAEVLAATDLADFSSRRLKTLSGGMIRRLGIAQALVAAPAVVVLDEPTVGLDPEQRAGFHDLLRRVAANRHVVVSTHLLEDVEAVADHVLVLDGGQQRFDGGLEALCRLGRGTQVTEQLRTAFLATLSASS